MRDDAGGARDSTSVAKPFACGEAFDHARGVVNAAVRTSPFRKVCGSKVIDSFVREKRIYEVKVAESILQVQTILGLQNDD